MPALQVREFPVDLYDELRARAAQENRSIAQQTIVVVREHLRSARKVVSAESASDATGGATATIDERAERRRRAFERLEAYPKVVIPNDFPSPAEIVRQMRDER